MTNHPDGSKRRHLPREVFFVLSVAGALAAAALMTNLPVAL